MRLYLPEEGEQRIAHSHALIQAVRTTRASIGGYAWAYGAGNPVATVENALALADDAGVRLPVLWADCELEAFDGTVYDYGPDERWLYEAANRAAKLGQRFGVYSAPWWWNAPQYPMRGSTLFGSLPIWKNDERAHASILDVPGFGGWTSVDAWQYDTGGGVDRSWLWDDLAWPLE